MPMGIQALLESRKLPVWSSDCQLPRIFIKSDAISMESDPITRIEDWQTTEPVHDEPVLHSFTTCYRRFIRKSAKGTFPKSN